MTRMQANLILLLAAAIWGGGFVAQSTAMGHVEANWYIGLRFLLATLALLPFAYWEHRRAAAQKPAQRLSFNHKLGFVAVGVVLAIAQTLQQAGLESTTVTNASFITGLYVLMVPILTVVVLRQKPHWVVWPAAFCCLLGMFFLSGGNFAHLSAGDFLVLICAFFFAIHISLTGRVMEACNRPLTLAAVQFAMTAAFGLINASLFEPISLNAIHSALPEILYGGLFSSGLAFSLQIIGQRYTTSSQAAIFLSAEALFGALLGALILGETLPPMGYLGCAMLFLAILAVEIVPEWSKFHRAAA